MDEAKVKRGIRKLIKAGRTLAQTLEQMDPATHDRARRIWAEVEGERRRAPAPSYRAAIAWVAEFDESANLDDDPESPDYVGGMPTILLVCHLFDKEVEQVVKDVVALRQKVAAGG